MFGHYKQLYLDHKAMLMHCLCLLQVERVPGSKLAPCKSTALCATKWNGGLPMGAADIRHQFELGSVGPYMRIYVIEDHMRCRQMMLEPNKKVLKIAALLVAVAWQSW